MLVEGLRVAPQERGKGVAGVLLRFCSELVKSKYPEVKVTRLTRDDPLGPKDFQKYRIITKQVPVANTDARSDWDCKRVEIRHLGQLFQSLDNLLYC